MVIQKIRLKDFRNYENVDIELNQGLNIFTGKNAQGKTNLLESIYISAIGKSYKTYKDTELIRWDMQDAFIQTIAHKRNREEKINIYINRSKKKGISINDLPINRMSKLLGVLNIVIFTPDDMMFFKEGPQVRRQYFDAQISQVDKIYFENIQSYYRVVKQRNNLLKNKNVSRETLLVWNEQLLKYGKEIMITRSGYLAELQKIIEQIHFSLTTNQESIEVVYKPNTDLELFEKNLNEKFEEEKKYMCSLVGPHKDDVVFKVNGHEIKKFCSQGQQRTAILALKFSEIELMKEKTGESPILLLDDVLSELDNMRKQFLIQYIKKVQTIITTTELDENLKEVLNESKVFLIENKQITNLDKV